jgi:hypothetical protein
MPCVYAILPKCAVTHFRTRSANNCHLRSVKLNADMPKRTPKPRPERKPAAPKAKPGPEERSHITSGINLPVDVYQLLNRVAFQRSLRQGGRPSVSGVIVSLVEQHRRELEKELAD